jgi:hypothetical protein
MSYQQWTVNRLCCDANGCDARGPTSSDSITDAYHRALDSGWAGHWNESYCPDHVALAAS